MFLSAAPFCRGHHSDDPLDTHNLRTLRPLQRPPSYHSPHNVPFFHKEPPNYHQTNCMTMTAEMSHEMFRFVFSFVIWLNQVLKQQHRGTKRFWHSRDQTTGSSQCWQNNRQSFFSLQHMAFKGLNSACVWQHKSSPLLVRDVNGAEQWEQALHTTYW